MTDDSGFGVPSTFGGVIPTPALDRIAEQRAALHEFQLDRAVLADARGADHRAQPSFGRLRRGRRAGDRLSRLRQHHHEGQGDDRQDPEGQRLSHVVVRQEPQHAGLPGEPRPARSTNGRSAWASSTSTASWAATPTSGSRTTSPATRRTFTRSVGNPSYNLITAMADEAIALHEPDQHADARPAVLRLLRAGRHACAASPDAGVDQEDQRHAPVRQGLERAARADLREPEEARRDPAGREADALAGRPAEEVGRAQRATRRRCSSARSTSSPPTSPTPTTRSAA